MSKSGMKGKASWEADVSRMLRGRFGTRARRLSLLVVWSLIWASTGFAQQEGPRTGPATEKRFPPLHVPKGFSARLFACDPLIEYPSVISLGPRPGALFVACDYVKGQGREITRRDDIRLLQDTDGDGYADRARVFASDFGSIQGLEWSDGTLYVMHAPKLTALRDADGDGVADERRDLLSGLGLPPEKNPSRLHCANGVVAGHDGWLYLAMGDNGCNVPRPEGDRLVFNGGGILRCRPDGRDLHVFAKGTRNIYDLALDDELNVFFRDNENDGGDFMVRVCFSFFDADHGYPYLYRDHPSEALPPLADLGRGSSAGGVCYRETQFPREMRGDLFFCEWGRAVVRYRPKRSASAFADIREHDFAFGDAEDPYGFKPTDLVILRDGTMMVSDWADGQSTRRGRARIYHIRYSGSQSEKKNQTPSPARPRIQSGLPGMIATLNSPSYSQRFAAGLQIEKQGVKGLAALRAALAAGRLDVRGRRHAVWIFAHLAGEMALDPLFKIAGRDADLSVRLQAVRAIADLTDPVLVRHKLAAGRGDAKIARRLAAAFDGQSAAVQREMVIAMGRLHWSDAPKWLAENLKRPDAALAHAAMQTIRRANHWPAALMLLDRPSSDAVRTIALRACSEQANVTVADGLMTRLDKERDSQRRRELADLLTRIWKKPAPWKYWGYRPAPRPANTETWERTAAIEMSLNRSLGGDDEPWRLFVLQRMQREGIPTRLNGLRKWLSETKTATTVSALLEAIGKHPAADIRQDLASVVLSRARSGLNRKIAVSMLAERMKKVSETALVRLAGKVEDGPVLASMITVLGRHGRRGAIPLIGKKLGSPDAEVRAASAGALEALKAAEMGTQIAPLLKDGDLQVRLAAVKAVGTLQVHDVSATLRRLAAGSDVLIRDASFRSLRLLKDRGTIATALAALKKGASELAALEYLAAMGGEDHANIIAETALRTPSQPILTAAVTALSRWSDQQKGDRGRELNRLIARIQGRHGVFLRLRVRGPLDVEEANRLISALTASKTAAAADETWNSVLADRSQVTLRGKSASSPRHWLLVADLELDEATAAQFQVSSRDALTIWINGKQAFHQSASGGSLKIATFSGQLTRGKNRALIRTVSSRSSAQFQLSFRRKSDSALHERLALLAMKQKGDAEKGRKLFLDVKKTQCIKCHRLGEQGERIGPDLTGVGSRFSRIHLIESILDPSRSIAPSYRTLAVILANGRTLSGVPFASDEQSISLADEKGEKHRILRADIKSQAYQSLSTMPQGLEKQLSPAEFVDLIAFLVKEKNR